MANKVGDQRHNAKIVVLMRMTIPARKLQAVVPPLISKYLWCSSYARQEKVSEQNKTGMQMENLAVRPLIHPAAGQCHTHLGCAWSDNALRNPRPDAEEVIPHSSQAD
ncbi:MAG: hypothetical protein LAP85_04300 [Acidobacteriia bacterium]|nr:hypothetical protein [Terriglobia bacterium]